MTRADLAQLARHERAHAAKRRPARHRPGVECPHWDWEEPHPDCACACTPDCTGEACRTRRS